MIGNIRLPAQLEGQPFDVVADVEGLIYWQYVNVGIVPVSQYDEYLQKRTTAPQRCSRSTRNPRKATVCAERSDTPVQTRTERLPITRRR